MVIAVSLLHLAWALSGQSLICIADGMILQAYSSSTSVARKVILDVAVWI